MTKSENVQWWKENKKFIIGMNLTVIGLLGMAFIGLIDSWHQIPLRSVEYLVTGWISGAMVVGGVAYLELKNRDEKIEKLQTKNSEIQAALSVEKLSKEQ